MEWYFTVKIIFGAAMNVIVTSPPDYASKADCLVYGLDMAIERAAWRQPSKIEVSCQPAGLAMAPESADSRYEPPPRRDAPPRYRTDDPSLHSE